MMLNEYTLQLAASLYLQGKSFRFLEIKFNTSWETLRMNFVKMGIDIRPQVKHSFNENYFEKVDSHEKAYFLGLLFADGCVGKNRANDKSVGHISISLVEDDSYILDAFKKALGFPDKKVITERESKSEKRQKSKSFKISSKKAAKDIVSLGMKERKTYVGGVPILDKEYTPSFILGFFDGDGCAYIRESEKHKEKKCSFEFACNFDIALFIQNFLKENGIESQIKKGDNKEMWILKCSGNMQCAKFFSLMYKEKYNLPVFLKRKYFKAKYFLEKFRALTKLKFNVPSGTKQHLIEKWAERNLSKEKQDLLKLDIEEINKRKVLKPCQETTKIFINIEKEPELLESLNKITYNDLP